MDDMLIWKCVLCGAEFANEALSSPDFNRQSPGGELVHKDCGGILHPQIRESESSSPR